MDETHAQPDQVNMEDLDFNLVEATLASIHTKTLTPIIKEELKLKIQTNRLAAGKQELPKPVFREPEKCEMTAEELRQREHRREMNKVAARKCRNKRKIDGERKKTKLAELQLRNFSLRQQLQELEDEKSRFIKSLLDNNINVPASVSISTEPDVITATHTNTVEPENYAETTQDGTRQLTTPTPPPLIGLSSPTPPPAINYTDLPSTSSGIFDSPGQHLPPASRRFSAEPYRPPPPYGPRRHSTEVPFSRYIDMLLPSYSESIHTSTFASGEQSMFSPEANMFNLGVSQAPLPTATQVNDHANSVPDVFNQSVNKNPLSSATPVKEQITTISDLDLDFLSDNEMCAIEDQSFPVNYVYLAPPTMEPSSTPPPPNMYHDPCCQNVRKRFILDDGDDGDKNDDQCQDRGDKTETISGLGDVCDDRHGNVPVPVAWFSPDCGEVDEMRMMEDYYIPLPRLEVLTGDEATVPEGDDVVCPTTPNFY